MWLFDTPKNYPEMLKKIAWTMFFVVAIGLFVISHISTDLANIMSEISFGVQYESSGIKIYISYLYIPLIFALLENIIKIHNKISDLLKIRYRFDKNVIIKKSLELCNKTNKLTLINQSNRVKIMSNIFYKYAGYANPSIDVHLIYMALGTWSWYWIFLDTFLATSILGILYLAISFSWISLITISIILFFILIIMRLIYCSCKKHAIREVCSIFDDEHRKHEICCYLSHISD